MPDHGQADGRPQLCPPPRVRKEARLCRRQLNIQGLDLQASQDQTRLQVRHARLEKRLHGQVRSEAIRRSPKGTV